MKKKFFLRISTTLIYIYMYRHRATESVIITTLTVVRYRRFYACPFILRAEAATKRNPLGVSLGIYVRPRPDETKSRDFSYFESGPTYRGRRFVRLMFADPALRRQTAFLPRDLINFLALTFHSNDKSIIVCCLSNRGRAKKSIVCYIFTLTNVTERSIFGIYYISYVVLWFGQMSLSTRITDFRIINKKYDIRFQVGNTDIPNCELFSTKNIFYIFIYFFIPRRRYMHVSHHMLRRFQATVVKRVFVYVVRFNRVFVLKSERKGSRHVNTKSFNNDFWLKS